MPCVCPHLLINRTRPFRRRFTGHGLAFDLVCPECHAGGASERRTACGDCFRWIQANGDFAGYAGEPEIRTRATSLRFRHRTVTLTLPGPLADIQPMEGDDRQRWVGLVGDGGLVLLDLDEGTWRLLGAVPTPEAVNALRLSPDGGLAAVVQERGQHGVVVDLETGRVTMALDRGDYHEEHCVFSAAFAVLAGCLVLVHATAWNRLDVSDPRTGELLTVRTSPTGGHGRGDHYLDYFHCGLTISPDARYVADNGWCWHPVGVVTTWSLAAWLGGNVWESEDGPTRKELCGQDLWDGPLCWLDGRRLAVWGQGDDEPRIPAARIFDVTTGAEECLFPGPKGEFFFDDYLFSCDQGEGTTVWDADTGERLLHDPDTRPTRYHRSAKSFLTVLPNGECRISKLVGQPLAWRSEAVLHVARGIAAVGTFDELPVLADALEEAGCDDTALLAHCRHPGPHGRECWAVDRILDAGG